MLDRTKNPFKDPSARPKKNQPATVSAPSYNDVERLILQLKEELKAGGWTQKELAQKSGIAQGNISNILKLKSAPSLRTLLRIAEAAGLRLKFV